jgi:hypothetical protein
MSSWWPASSRALFTEIHPPIAIEPAPASSPGSRSAAPCARRPARRRRHDGARTSRAGRRWHREHRGAQPVAGAALQARERQPCDACHPRSSMAVAAHATAPAGISVRDRIPGRGRRRGATAAPDEASSSPAARRRHLPDRAVAPRTAHRPSVGCPRKRRGRRQPAGSEASACRALFLLSRRLLSKPSVIPKIP